MFTEITVLYNHDKITHLLNKLIELLFVSTTMVSLEPVVPYFKPCYSTSWARQTVGEVKFPEYIPVSV